VNENLLYLKKKLKAVQHLSCNVMRMKCHMTIKKFGTKICTFLFRIIKFVKRTTGYTYFCFVAHIVLEDLSGFLRRKTPNMLETKNLNILDA
jgi:hypothetical protein